MPVQNCYFSTNLLKTILEDIVFPTMYTLSNVSLIWRCILLFRKRNEKNQKRNETIWLEKRNETERKKF
jgi:hypothetical protein